MATQKEQIQAFLTADMGLHSLFFHFWGEKSGKKYASSAAAKDAYLHGIPNTAWGERGGRMGRFCAP
jgi:hypothetical protein